LPSIKASKTVPAAAAATAAAVLLLLLLLLLSLQHVATTTAAATTAATAVAAAAAAGVMADAVARRFKVPPLTHYGWGAVMSASCALMANGYRGGATLHPRFYFPS